jgi:hypothetical protein
MRACIKLILTFLAFTLLHIAYEGPWYVTWGDWERAMAFSLYVTGAVECYRGIVFLSTRRLYNV